MILFQSITIELLWNTNDKAFTHFPISTFICPASLLSSFTCAKERCKVTKKHTLYFPKKKNEVLKLHLWVGDWSGSPNLCSHLCRRMCTHKQKWWKQVGGCHRSTCSYSGLSEGICLWPHACVWEQEKGGNAKGLLQPWLLEHFTLPCTHHLQQLTADLRANENVRLRKSDFSNASNRQPTSSQGKQTLVYLKNVFCAWNQNTPLNNIMWWKTKGTKEVLVTASCCVKSMQHEVYIFMWV